MFDVVIRGGVVLDGTGAPGFHADVAVAGDAILEVGPVQRNGVTEIDATGRYVLPGFVDTHVHGDSAVFEPGMQRAALRQGITTVVLGQDGMSYAPAGADTMGFVSRYFAPVNGRLPRHHGDGPVSVAGLLAGYHRGTPLNTVYLLPHGTIRHEVMGVRRGRPDEGELAAMRRRVERGLEEGAAGLSTGLEYVPGGFAEAAELIELCRPVAEAGLPYVTHMRGYEDRAARGMAEVLEIARGGGVAPHVSHYHGPGRELAKMVDDARAEGLDLTFDSYPYLRGCSTLTLVTLPGWLPAADLDATVAALADPAVRDRLRREWPDDLWPRITLAHVPADGLRWAEGLDIPTAAKRAGTDPAEFCCEVLAATGLEAGCVFAQPPTATDDSMRMLLRHPAQMLGSDGIYQGGHPHPRGWGAFARALRRHVRELGDWTWEQAALHLAGHPARRFRLDRRGLVRPGQAADLLVLDPAAVADRATYERPREPADGVDHVLVNGVAVLAGGEMTGACSDDPPGRALTPR